MDILTRANVVVMKGLMRAVCCLLVVVLTACGSSKTVSVSTTVKEANTLASEGSYSEAFEKYASAESAKWDSVTYRLATITASETEHDSLACAWGYVYSSKGDIEKLKALNATLVRLNRPFDRVYLIMENEEIFVEMLGQGEVAKEEAVYYATYNDSRLADVYDKIEDIELRAELFDKYFKIKKKTATATELQAICKAELKNTPELKGALRYLAVTRYDEANDMYNKAMAEYNKKKSQAAYAYLTRDLKKTISPAFRECRDYFEKLHSLEPSNKDYINYLINIYTRLENKTKVDELKKQL